MINARELEVYNPRYQYRNIGQVYSMAEACQLLRSVAHNYPSHPRQNKEPRLLTVEELCEARIIDPTLRSLNLLTSINILYDGADHFKIGTTNSYEECDGMRFGPMMDGMFSNRNVEKHPLFRELCGSQIDNYVHTVRQSCAPLFFHPQPWPKGYCHIVMGDGVSFMGQKNAYGYVVVRL